MLKAAASCVLASRKASTCTEHASALRSAAVLLYSDFEHPGKSKAVSKAIRQVSRWIKPKEPMVYRQSQTAHSFPAICYQPLSSSASGHRPSAIIDISINNGCIWHHVQGSSRGLRCKTTEVAGELLREHRRASTAACSFPLQSGA